MTKRHAVLLALALLTGTAAFAQSDSIPSSLSGADDDRQTQDSGQSLGDLARKVRKDHSEETKMTDEDAKKLFADVDRIANFASEDSGFPLHTPVKRRMISPDELEKSARENLAKPEYADRFARAELTMKKFGLLPRDFNLREFLVKTERKDIAAYYDYDSKTISLLNTIPVEQQEAILAHELTHALQDQNYGLHSWLKAGESDESSTARRAVVEGQATVVFLDYLLARLGRNVENTPGIIYRMEDPAVKYAVDSQLMHDAPMILREWGTFPYREGLIFEGELLQSGGKKLAFQEVFANPPRSTHEIIQPRAYLDREKISPPAMPDAKVFGSEYDVYDSGTLGELDVRALLWQLGTRTLADDLSKSWRGGSYIAVRKKAAGPTTASDLKLLYLSRWSSPEAAQRFAKFYISGISRRYQAATPDPGAACVGAKCPVFSSTVSTEEGPVLVDLWSDNTVLVSESFDQDTAAKLVTATRDMAENSAQIAFPGAELGMRFYDSLAFRRWQAFLGAAFFSKINLNSAGK